MFLVYVRRFGWLTLLGKLNMTKQNSNAQTSEQGKPADQRRSDADRRLSVLDRRVGLDRRRKTEPVAVDRRAAPDRRAKKGSVGIDRRRGPGIRREEDRRAAEEGEMTDEQFEFVTAVDRYKRANSRPFPTLTEILEIIQALGYRKID